MDIPVVVVVLVVKVVVVTLVVVVVVVTVVVVDVWTVVANRATAIGTAMATAIKPSRSNAANADPRQPQSPQPHPPPSCLIERVRAYVEKVILLTLCGGVVDHFLDHSDEECLRLGMDLVMAWDWELDVVWTSALVPPACTESLWLDSSRRTNDVEWRRWKSQWL